MTLPIIPDPEVRANAVSQHRATHEPSQSSLSWPSGWVSAFAVICDELLRPSANVEWLERAGPIAKQLNEQSQRDGSAAQEAAPGKSNG